MRKVVAKDKKIGIVAAVCIVLGLIPGIVSAAGFSKIIPIGQVDVYDGDQKIATLTKEAPLPQGKTLKVNGKCGIKSKFFSIVATDKSNLMVNTDGRTLSLWVNDGKVFFGITTLPGPITFVTPIGSVVAQQVMMKAADQQSILEGYVTVSGDEAEIGIISGGAMVISTADGEVTLKEGQRFLLAQAKVPDPAAIWLSGGTVGAIMGTTLGTMIILPSILDDDTVSPKQ